MDYEVDFFECSWIEFYFEENGYGGGIHSIEGERLFIPEMKMEIIDSLVIKSFCPLSDCQFVIGPAVGSAGGILLV